MDSSPISIYVHLPFCDRKCHFCDCYSLQADDPVADQRVRLYTRALLREIEAWAHSLPLTLREVTTVHLGGGTPSFLAPEDLRAIVDALRSRFNTTASTEWALETTTTQLTPQCLRHLYDLGFKRLHVGVQTLEEPARRLAGRKEAAAAVEEKLHAALASGMVVTVDVIYGLPAQTVEGFVDTLGRLDALGVHGFSLYKLNITTHNRHFARRFGLDRRHPCEGFFMFQIGESFLRARGYRKTHFAHFSRPEDCYLYYTHARRGEGLLALGATADGSFGPLHYRHPEVGEYVRPRRMTSPCLAGATYETPLETALQPATSCLMTASLPASLMKQLGMDKLLAEWTADGLLRPAASSAEFELTASGSYLISSMLEELNMNFSRTYEPTGVKDSHPEVPSEGTHSQD